MYVTFLPFNYQSLMYQRLQNLRQGNHSVDDYTTEFYQLIAHNKVQETEDQLVARYIGGLREQIIKTVNMFYPMSIFAAHQWALQVEKRRPGVFIQTSGYGGVVSRGSGGMAQ